MASPTQHLDRLCERLNDRPDVSQLKLHVTDRTGAVLYTWSPPGASASHAVASSTKMVAASLLLGHVSRGDLRLEQPLASILPREEVVGLNRFDGRDRVDEITVRDVMAHATGIPDYYEKKRLKPGVDVATHTAADPGWTYGETLGIARSMPARFAPHSGQAHYSATNYQLVGRLIEIVTGSSIADALQKEVLGPLGMADTWLLTPDTVDDLSAASPLLVGSESYLGARRLASLGAEGALVSTTADMMRFIRAAIDGVLPGKDMLDLALRDRLQIFPRVEYGVGVMMIALPRWLTRLPKPGLLVGHAGMTGHVMFADPVTGLAVTGTINQLAPSRVPYNFLMAALRQFARS